MVKGPDLGYICVPGKGVVIRVRCQSRLIWIESELFQIQSSQQYKKKRKRC